MDPGRPLGQMGMPQRPGMSPQMPIPRQRPPTQMISGSPVINPTPQYPNMNPYMPMPGMPGPMPGAMMPGMMPMPGMGGMMPGPMHGGMPGVMHGHMPGMVPGRMMPGMPGMMPPTTMFPPRPMQIPMPIPVPLPNSTPTPNSTITPAPNTNSTTTPVLPTTTNVTMVRPALPYGPAEKYTTLFVGSIQDGVDDTLLEKLLRCCGGVKKWKRVKDQEGKSKAFGFCEFEDADVLLRALRLLNNFTLAGKQLNVKVDESTSKYLDDYQKMRTDITPESIEESDATHKASIEAFLQENKSVLDSLDPAMKSEGSDKKNERHDSPDKDGKSSRKDREMELHFRDRLRKWEGRERQKLKEYEKEKDREEERVQAVERNRQRLLATLEDPKLNKDDEYYIDRSRWRGRRKREREREEENDARDRAKEHEELEEIKKKEEERLQKELEEKRLEAMMEDKQKERASEIKAVIKQEIKDMFDFDEQKGPQLTNSFSQVQVQEGKTQDEKLGFGLSLKLNPTTQTTTTTGTKRKPTQFTLELDEENSQVKKRTLIPIVYTVEEMMAIGLTKEEIEKKQKEEKKKQIQDIIDRIPVEKDQLFAYQIPWELVDQEFREKKLRPWINKKLTEYLGGNDDELCQFILEEISKKTLAQEISGQLEIVLDKDAEVFVIKLWRFMIYESEAKKLLPPS